MDKNKIIILALIVVIAVLLVGMAAMMMSNMGKQDTKLKFKSNSTMEEGGSLKVKLTDANGTAIANQTVNVTITDKDKSNSYYSVVTNEKGVGTLKLDKSTGKYDVTIVYGGNDKYNGCNATKKLTIKEKVAEAEPATQSTSSASTSTSSGDYYYTVDSDGQLQQHMTPEREAQERANFYKYEPPNGRAD
ncbi:Ig-like domain-containing protein [Methanobrevibacter sp.]|uniref:Ig-like domain-containing protein n=1 Tax=Methanobrevibacter sp. TaxID=66852 RepID=UPI0038689431